MKYPKVTIIILNWNGKDDTIECLDSLKSINYSNFEILLVDNGSIDGSVDCFKNEYPSMEIIQNKENLGFAEGNNVGIKRAMENGTDYVLLLNNDTVVDSYFLTELVMAAETDSEIGIVGPKIYYYSKSQIIHSAGGTIIPWKATTHHIGILEVDHRQYDKVREMNFMTGCVLLLKRAILEEIGFLDASFFMYWEDADYCTRATKKGWKIIYVPASKVYHKVSSSSGHNNPLTTYYLTRNSLLFTKKNHPLLLPTAIFSQFYYQLFFHIIKGQFMHFKMGLYGYYDFFRNKLGKFGGE